MYIYMSGVKINTWAIFSAIYVFVFFALNCAPPRFDPEGIRWTPVASTKVEVRNLACSGGSVWLVGCRPDSSVGHAKILRWDGVTLEEIYSDADEGSSLTDVGFRDNMGWAVGRVSYPGPDAPLLIAYENGVWSRDNNIPAGLNRGFYSLAVTGPDSFWVTAGDAIYEYDSGSWAGPFLLDGIRGIVYGGGSVCAWSADSVWVYNGAGWVLEKPNPGLNLHPHIIDAYGVPGGVFFAVYLEYGNDVIDYYGILYRAAAPAGEGDYTLEFFAPPGPYILDFNANCAAFYDVFNGAVLGQETDVFYKDGKFNEAELPLEYGVPRAVSVDDNGASWMVAARSRGVFTLYEAPR